MIRTVIRSVGAAAAVGAGFGLVAAITGATETDAVGVAWREPSAPKKPTVDLTERLLSTGHFAENKAQAEEEPSVAPPAEPPRTVAVIVKGGETLLTLLSASGQLINGKIGDVVEGDWIIISVSPGLQEVTFERGDERRVLSVFGAKDA